MQLQCLPIKKITGARGTLTTLYRTLCTWLFGCLLALCGSTMHPARLCGGFRTIVFCLVCGPLKKKKTLSLGSSLLLRLSLPNCWVSIFFLPLLELQVEVTTHDCHNALRPPLHWCAVLFVASLFPWPRPKGHPKFSCINIENGISGGEAMFPDQGS